MKIYCIYAKHDGFATIAGRIHVSKCAVAVVCTAGVPCVSSSAIPLPSTWGTEFASPFGESRRLGAKLHVASLVLLLRVNYPTFVHLLRTQTGRGGKKIGHIGTSDHCGSWLHVRHSMYMFASRIQESHSSQRTEVTTTQAALQKLCSTAVKVPSRSKGNHASRLSDLKIIRTSTSCGAGLQRAKPR